MVFAQDASLVLSDLLVQGDGFIEALSRRVCACEVVARVECAGMVCAQEASLVLSDLFVQGNGFIEAARRLVWVCESIACAECER